MRKSRVVLLSSSMLAVSSLCAAVPASSEPRSGLGPCRQGVLALMAMIDRGEVNSADYKHAFSAVVETCGPVVKSKAAPRPAGTAQCGKLALQMLDEIESNRMNGAAFVKVRDAFAQGCAPA